MRDGASFGAIGVWLTTIVATTLGGSCMEVWSLFFPGSCCVQTGMEGGDVMKRLSADLSDETVGKST